LKFAQCHQLKRGDRKLLLIKRLVNSGLNYEDYLMGPQ
jgi:hypothetical protein